MKTIRRERWLGVAALFAVCAATRAADSPHGSVPQTEISSPRALSVGRLPDDHRLGPLQNFDGHFPFTVPATREAWERRAEQVRRQLLVAPGLWPMPTRTPLNAVVHGRVDREDYTVEKVYLRKLSRSFRHRQSLSAQGQGRPAAGVLCPHGHWKRGPV